MFNKPIYASFILLLFLLALSACSTVVPSLSIGQTLPILPSANQEQLASCMAPEVGRIHLGLSRFIDKLKNQSDSALLTSQLDLMDDKLLIEDVLQLRSELKTVFDRLGTNISIFDAVEHRDNSVFQNLIQKAQAIAEEGDYPEQDVLLFKKLIHAYLRAYFIKPINTGILNSQADADLRQSIADIFKRRPNDRQINEVMALLQPKLAQAKISGGFIDLDGSQFGFPGISATGNTQVVIDHSQIGADLIRIFLDAMRDTLAPIPILAGATASTLDASFDTLNFNDNTEVISLLWHMERRDSNNIAAISISARQFQDMQARAKQAEASTATMVGKAIRGGALGSLNNEALARQLETAAGVLARQTTERAQWCLLAQGRH